MTATATGREVMLVEDDSAIRDTLAELLVDEGFKVHAVSNGRDALAQLRSGQPPHLILLDLMMPVMDGWEFRRAQQRDPSLAKIPVIVLSADHPLDEKVSEMSVAGFLAKPFELGTLLDAIHRYC